MRKKTNAIIALAITSTLVFSGCGAAKTSQAASDQAAGAEKILIGIRQDLYPSSYIDENGKPAGYDIEIIQKVDELLPQYEFSYEAVSQEALLTGLQTGKYAAAVAGFYSNDERREKYLFPEECIGGNLISIVVRTEDSNLTDLESVYDAGKTLEPIATTSGMYGIVLEYNKEHPDKQLELIDSDWTDAAEQYQWIADGRYDVCVSSKNVFDETIPAIGLGDKLVNINFTAIKTWSMFHPEQKELAAAYDGALKQLKEDGTISKLSEQYFGEDVLPYIEEE